MKKTYVDRKKMIDDHVRDLLNIDDTLMYEVYSSWWAPFIGHPFLQNLAAMYFAWRVKRKHRRYKKHCENRKKLILENKFDINLN